MKRWGPTTHRSRTSGGPGLINARVEGTGVIRGDLTRECAAVVQAVLDAVSAPVGGGDLRTRPQRHHDALEEATRNVSGEIAS